jgi:hypothetical protein
VEVFTSDDADLPYSIFLGYVLKKLKSLVKGEVHVSWLSADLTTCNQHIVMLAQHLD